MWYTERSHVYLEFLRKKGVIKYDSIQGGNVYGSLEGAIMKSSTLDPIKATVLNISEWMKTEEPYIQGTTAYEEMEDEMLLRPFNGFNRTRRGASSTRKRINCSGIQCFRPMFMAVIRIRGNSGFNKFYSCLLWYDFYCCVW